MTRGKPCFKLKRRAGALLGFGLALLLFLAVLAPPAQAAAGAGTESLLQEIAEQVERHYLFAPEGGVELRSLEELPRLWQDPHSAYLDREQFRLFTQSLERSLTGIGVYLEKDSSFAVTVVSAVPGSPAARAGIREGDVIVAVDGRLVLDFPLEKVVALLRGEEGSGVKLLVRRGAQLREFSLVRERIKLPAVEYSLLPGEMALLRLYNFGAGAAREVSSSLEALQREGVRGVILDLRANQGGYVEEALAVAALFTEGPLLQVREKDTGWQVVRRERAQAVSLPLVVLLGRGTASGAEILAAALKDNGAALLVGANSFGKGTMQTLIPLSNGAYLKLTTTEFASPRLNRIEGVGVEPHFLVPEPRQQEERARSLLQSVLAQELGSGESYLARYLRLQEGEPALLPPAAYPLRRLLGLTGRPILAQGEPGIYSFTWEGRDYLLDLKQGLLYRAEAPPGEAAFPVVLQGGTTYVPRSFLAEGLGLPFLPH